MRRARTPRRSSAPLIEVTVARLGALGDGVAESGTGGSLHVPFAAPGDRLRVRTVSAGRGGTARSEIVARLADGPGRVEPPCPHFGACGGCAVQHIADAAYVEWKRGLLVEALARRGLSAAAVVPLVRIPPGARRRVRFQVWRGGGRVTLGFFGPRSRTVVGIRDCIVLVPPLAGLIAPLRDLLGDLLPARSGAEAAVTLCDNGIDLTLGPPAPPDLAAREALVAFAEARDLARLSLRPFRAGTDHDDAEPLAARRPPVLAAGGIAIRPPPDGFVQPTGAGEAALRGRVEDALAGAARAADLYAGCGAFGLPLAAGGRSVAAFDVAAGPVAALLAAARAAGLGDRVTAEGRDIARQPLAAEELSRFDGVVLDPPRAGAESQARALAESTVPMVAYVSCNPASFARDARLLADGGYRLARVTPVDQFPWTPHLELVGEFVRRMP